MTEEVFLYLPLRVLQENFTLNTGRTFPKITLGVSDIIEFETIFDVLDIALEVGYRSFDCSPEFMVENSVGEALEELLPKHNLQRSDILITTKIHPRDYGMGSATEAFWHSCENLKTDYIDLFLMNWPGGHNLDSDDEENQYLREETWKEIVDLCSKGVIKNPGVCHFTPRQIEGIQICSDKFPAVVQAEFHPNFPQVDLLEYCKENNILLQACCLEETFHPILLNNEIVREVAKEIRKTPTQVLLN